MDKWTETQLPRLDGQRWLITGASDGIGAAAARAASAAGAHLILPVRNRAKGEKIAAELPGEVELIDFDLASLASVETAAAKVIEPVDVLINNAGTVSRTRQETRDGFELTLGVNFLAPFAFTGLVLPKVRRRIVIVGSNLHHLAMIDRDDPHWRTRRYSFQGAYGQSKLADMVWGFELERRLRGSEIDVQLAHPGWALTNLSNATSNQTVNRIITTLTTPIAQSAQAGARPTLFAATQNLPRGRYIGPDGWLHMRGWPVVESPAAHALSATTAAWLWDFAQHETGVSYLNQ